MTTTQHKYSINSTLFAVFVTTLVLLIGSLSATRHILVWNENIDTTLTCEDVEKRVSTHKSTPFHIESSNLMDVYLYYNIFSPKSPRLSQSLTCTLSSLKTSPLTQKSKWPKISTSKSQILIVDTTQPEPSPSSSIHSSVIQLDHESPMGNYYLNHTRLDTKLWVNEDMLQKLFAFLLFVGLLGVSFYLLTSIQTSEHLTDIQSASESKKKVQ